MAVAQGAKGIGPVTQPEQFAAAMKDGLNAVMNGEVCVIDARVLPGAASGERPRDGGSDVRSTRSREGEQCDE